MNKNKIEKLFAMVSVVIATALIVTGVCFVVMPQNSHSTEYTELAIFGADFYTEIHEAAKNAANNTADVVYSINSLRAENATYIGLIFVFSGLMLGLYNVKKLMLVANEEKETSVNLDEIVAETENLSPETQETEEEQPEKTAAE